MISEGVNESMVRRIKPSAEAQGVLRALRRAQLNALELGLQTGTPVIVMRNNQIVDLTKDEKAVAELRAERAKETKRKKVVNRFF